MKRSRLTHGLILWVLIVCGVGWRSAAAQDAGKANEAAAHEALPRLVRWEIVTDEAARGGGGNAWGGQQPRIVRTKDGLFTTYIVPPEGADPLNLATNKLRKTWRLARRTDDGWKVIAEGDVGRRPAQLLASPDGTLHVIGWPEKMATIWSGKPRDGMIKMERKPLPGGFTPSGCSRAGAGTNSAGDICFVGSIWTKPAFFEWAYYRADEDEWLSGRLQIDLHHGYDYVFPRPGGELWLVSNRDVRWQDLGYKRPPNAEAGWVMDRVAVWHSRDVARQPLKEVASIQERPSEEVPYVCVKCGYLDAYLDTRSRLHILYVLSGPRAPGGKNFHAVFSPDGRQLHNVELPRPSAECPGTLQAIFQDARERFFILDCGGGLWPVAEDGVTLGDPVQLDLHGKAAGGPGFFLSVPRTGTPLADVMDVVYTSSDRNEVIYFRVKLY